MFWQSRPEWVRTSDIEFIIEQARHMYGGYAEKVIRPVAERFSELMRDLLYIVTAPQTTMVFGLASHGLYEGEDPPGNCLSMSHAKDLEYQWLQYPLSESLGIWLRDHRKEPEGYQKRIVEVMLEKRYPEILERAISRSVVVLAWSAYEAMAGDLWASVVNFAPELFLPRALGKGINMRTLKKICLNAEDAIGQSLQRRMNMTSVTEIREAFEAIFSPETLPFMAMPDNQRLVELEMTRHLLMHKGGIVDNEFRQKTGWRDAPVGKPLALDVERASMLANAAIEQGCRLLQFVQGQLGYGQTGVVS